MPRDAPLLSHRQAKKPQRHQMLLFKDLVTSERSGLASDQALPSSLELLAYIVHQ